jgi:hypothetical protein
MSFDNKCGLYIPYVFPNITEERIKKIFSCLNIGEVSRIDFIKKYEKNGKMYYEIYIHFSNWYYNVTAFNFQKKVVEGNGAKLVYDDPWFWLVYKNTSDKAAKQIANLENQIRKSKVDRDFIMLEMKQLREENEKLKCMIEDTTTENYYITQEMYRLESEKKHLLDELQAEILENDYLMSLDYFKNKK